MAFEGCFPNFGTDHHEQYGLKSSLLNATYKLSIIHLMKIQVITY